MAKVETIPKQGTMPSLNDEDVCEFQEIYRKAFHEDLSEGEARIMAQNLINLYLVLSRPLPSEVMEKSAKTPSVDSPDKSAAAKVHFRPSSLTKVVDILPKKKPEM